MSLFFLAKAAFYTQQNPPHCSIQTNLCCVASYSFLDPRAQGPRQPAGYHAFLLYCWVANYSNSGGKKEERKTKKRKTCLFLCPHRSAGILCLWFLLFSVTKGSFHCCQLNGSLYVLHPIPTHHSLSLSLSLCLSAAVSSSSFLGILPFKYSFCRSAAVFFLFLQSLKGQRISDNSCLSLMAQEACLRCSKIAV